jgi:hypothetical protein
MGKQNFWALPDAWRAAFPPGLLVGVLVIGGLAVTESARGGLDRLFWVEGLKFALVTLITDIPKPFLRR